MLDVLNSEHPLVIFQIYGFQKLSHLYSQLHSILTLMTYLIPCRCLGTTTPAPSAAGTAWMSPATSSSSDRSTLSKPRTSVTPTRATGPPRIADSSSTTKNLFLTPTPTMTTRLWSRSNVHSVQNSEVMIWHILVQHVYTRVKNIFTFGGAILSKFMVKIATINTWLHDFLVQYPMIRSQLG